MYIKVENEVLFKVEMEERRELSNKMFYLDRVSCSIYRAVVI